MNERAAQARTDRPIGANRRAGRYRLLLLPAAMLLLVAVLSSATTAAPSPAPQNAVAAENSKAGSKGWESSLLTGGTGIADEDDNTNPAAPQAGRSAQATVTGAGSYDPGPISAYTGQVSVDHGAPADLYVSTNRPSYNVEVYRVGWYGGSGAPLIQSYGNLPGSDQGVPAPDSDTGLVDAHWHISLTIQTTTDWVSGVYLVKLIASDGSVGYTLFVVRDGSATADILVQLPVNTWEAYNNWGGKSLYDFNSTDGRAFKVSFNRPYASPGTGNFFDGNENMIRFLEREGYNVTYATSVDLQTNPGLMRNRKVFLSDFHDEYWSGQIRDAGTSLAFFDSNDIYWQIRYEPATDGAANRTIVCYKDATLDPLAGSNPAATTVQFRNAPVKNPDNALLGVMYENNWGSYSISFPWVVQNASNWVYDGTGL